MKYNVDWFSHNIPSIKKAVEGKESEKVNMLEIGCNEGRSTVWFLENLLLHDDSRITVIDTFNSSSNYKPSTAKKSPLQKTFEENIKETGKAEKVFVYKGMSQDVMRTMPTMPRFDVVYVDGSHYAPDVLEDLIYVYRMVKKGGLIICDDYELGYGNNTGNGYDNPNYEELPKNAIDTFKKMFKDQVEVVFAGYIMVLRRK